MPKFRVTFSNPGGELDGRIVPSKTAARDALLKMVADLPYVDPGDTFAITEVDDNVEMIDTEG